MTSSDKFKTTLPSRGAEDSTEAIPPGARSPRVTVPGYRLLRRLGEGGMGEVYEAEQQEPVRRTVALKVIKWGMDTEEVIGRFESERQALALMDHPNIARVFDAGATDRGRPYFAMELVQGVAITDYCDRHHLSTRQRLELFMRVCEGVQHAHQKGIIHRDLKPSNVLVKIQDGQPVPKIIDFGLAKATAQRETERTVFTKLGQLIGTPAYMSPEQAEMTGLDIDTRTDIYSLGVLLYELLVGARPFDAKKLREAGLDEILRHIREEEPRRPSSRLSELGKDSSEAAENRGADPHTLVRSLRGDLDWIVMKALEKDRTRRYETASALALDIERHLTDVPVEASPPSTTYRMKKFVLRHKVGVAAGAVVVLALVLGIAGTTTGLIRAQRAERRATAEAEAAQEISEFLVELFEVSDPGEARGETITAREILDRGAQRLDTELADQPLIQARLMDTIGTVYEELGLYEDASVPLKEALSTREGLLGSDHPDVAQSLDHLAGVYLSQGKYEEAEPLFRRSLEIRETVLGPEHPDVAGSLNNLALVYDHQGKYAEAEQLHLRSIEIREKAFGPDHPNIASALDNLAILYDDQGRYEEAETLFLRSLEIDEKALGTDHPDVATSLDHLAGLYWAQARYEEAEPLFLRSLEISEKVLGPDHPDVAGSLNNLAILYDDQGRYEEAEPLYLRSIEIKEAALGPDHPSVGGSLNNLAILYDNLGKPEEAESLYLRSIEIQEAALGPDHPDVGDPLSNLAILYEDQGRYEEAEPLHLRSLEIREKGLGPDHPAVATSVANLAILYIHQGKLAQAEPLFHRSLAVWEKALCPEHPDLAYPLHGLGNVCRDQQRYSDAEAHYERALALREKSLPSDDPDLVGLREDYAALLRSTGREEEARELEAGVTGSPHR